MDFWGTYEKKRSDPQFGFRRLALNTGERHIASALRLIGRSLEINTGESLRYAYSEARRYVAAPGIGFDALISFYDVNTKSGIMLRPASPVYPAEVKIVAEAVSALRKPRLEMRAIGMQDGHAFLVETMERLSSKINAELVEADLFGGQIRHIIMDMKTGKPYNLLLENRIYRPGELNNTVEWKSFEGASPKLNLENLGVKVPAHTRRA